MPNIEIHTYSFTIHLSSAYYGPDSVLCAWVTLVNKIDFPVNHGAYILADTNFKYSVAQSMVMDNKKSYYYY